MSTRRTNWDNFSSSDKLKTALCDPKCVASGTFVDYIVSDKAP